jgi:hypothetical protein
MSARKLGRLAGLVFVLAAVFGGIGVASHVSKHETGGTAAASVVKTADLEIIWG